MFKVGTPVKAFSVVLLSLRRSLACGGCYLSHEREP